METLISIIVPIYNTEKYLKKCLESIINQTYKNLEIILINDGSTDDSLNICEHYQKIDSRIFIISKENGGQHSAICRGIEQAHGNYVSILDSDDWIEENMIESLIQLIGDADIVSTGLYKHDISGEIIDVWVDLFDEGTYREEDNYFWENLIIHQNRTGEIVIGGLTNNRCTKLFKLDILKRVYKKADIKISLNEDFVLVLLYILECKKIKISHNCYYHYMDNSQSISHKVDSTFLEEMTRFESIAKYIQQHRMSECMLDQFYRRYMFYLYSGICDNTLIGKKYGFPKYDWKDKSIIQGKKIVLFGAGKVGRSLHKVWELDNQIEIVGWIDNAVNELGTCITEAQSIKNMDYDYVVCAVLNKNRAENMRNQLKSLNVPDEKIIWKEPINILECYFL